ncbi:radical SAM protein [Heliobacterium gestii]|uniref:Radical SAM protein n=1 Tax=Heliomicrobium gestii TaxID=2699 RepID=A0A845LF02_HELGE|nr:radical SAM protein [Heliomicrobium gestii]MBM7866695.1 radical SAM protein with 4Fe4S-binding SPASM domain [Heliomicrobium gestii]MZP43025.1 radical SAM protein [Heliomicrobium gestii]
MYPRSEQNDQLAGRIGLTDLSQCELFPKYFEIETVNLCNARCIMCTIDKWEKKASPFMSMELFHKFAEEVGQYRDWIETICLNRDGEPTLDKDLPLRVKMLKDGGIKRVTMSTNGQRLDADLAERLLAAGLNDIMISIDGCTKETFEGIRRGLQFETVVENAQNFIRLRDKGNHLCTVRIRMVVMEENQHEVEPWLAFWSPLLRAGDKAYAMPAHTWGNQLSPEEEAEISRFSAHPCISPFSSMAMHVDGTVGICAVDYNVKFPMGDFRRQSIKEIWNGEAFRNVRSFHATQRRNEIDFCRGCHIWDRQYHYADKE